MSKSLRALLYGDLYAEKLDRFYNGLLQIEEEYKFQLRDGELSPYLIVSYSSAYFRTVYREDLPKEIQTEIDKLSDSIFGKQ